MKFRGYFLLLVCLGTLTPVEADGFLFRMIQNMRANRSRRMMQRRCMSRRCQPRNNRIDENALIDNNFLGVDNFSDPNVFNRFIANSDGGLPPVQTGFTGAQGGFGSNGRVSPAGLLGDTSAAALEGTHSVDLNRGEETTKYGTYPVRSITRGFRGTVRDRFTNAVVQPFIGQLVVQDRDGSFFTADPRTVAQYYQGYKERQRLENPIPAQVQNTLAAYAPIESQLLALAQGGTPGTGPGQTPGTSTSGQHTVPAITGAPDERPTGEVIASKFQKWSDEYKNGTKQNAKVEDVVKMIETGEHQGTDKWDAQVIKQTCVNEWDSKSESGITLVLFASKEDPKKAYVRLKLGHDPLDIAALTTEFAKATESETNYKPQVKRGDLLSNAWTIDGKRGNVFVNRYAASAQVRALGYQEAQIQLKPLTSTSEKPNPGFITRFVYKSKVDKPGEQEGGDFEYYCKNAPAAPAQAAPTGATQSKVAPVGGVSVNRTTAQNVLSNACARCHNQPEAKGPKQQQKLSLDDKSRVESMLDYLKSSSDEGRMPPGSPRNQSFIDALENYYREMP